MNRPTHGVRIFLVRCATFLKACSCFSMLQKDCSKAGVIWPGRLPALAVLMPWLSQCQNAGTSNSHFPLSFWLLFCRHQDVLTDTVTLVGPERRKHDHTSLIGIGERTPGSMMRGIYISYSDLVGYLGFQASGSGHWLPFLIRHNVRDGLEAAFRTIHHFVWCLVVSWHVLPDIALCNTGASLC